MTELPPGPQDPPAGPHAPLGGGDPSAGPHAPLGGGDPSADPHAPLGGGDPSAGPHAPLQGGGRSPSRADLCREAAVLAVPALFVAALVSWACAREQRFIGTLDLLQIFAQAHNLLVVWATGDSNSVQAFLGLPTPYTYSPSLHEFGLPLLLLSRLTNPWFALNFLTLGVPVANGVAMYLLLRATGLRRLSSSFGGFMYLVAAPMLRRLMVDVYLAQAFFLPVLFYLFYRDRRRGFHWGHWALAGATVALMAGAHEYLGLLGVGIVAIGLACNARRLERGRLLGATVASAVAFIVLEAPVLWMYIAQRSYDRATGTVFERPLAHSIHMSCTFADYCLPGADHFLWSHVPRLVNVGGYYENSNYLGLVNLLALSILLFWAVFRRERLRAFVKASPLLDVLRWELIVTGISVLVVSFGPRLKSMPSICLPVEWLRAIPPFTMVRGWGRFGFVIFFVLTLVAAHLVDGYLRRFPDVHRPSPPDPDGPVPAPPFPLPASPSSSGPSPSHHERALPGPSPAGPCDSSRTSRRATILVILLMAVALVDLVPMLDVPTVRIPFPTALEAVRRAPGEFLVLHLPLSCRTGPLHNGVAQFLQPFHGKRTVNGYPAFDVERFLEAVLASPLQQLDHRMRACRPGDGSARLGGWLVENDVRFIIYEKQTMGYYPPHFDESEDVQLRSLTLRLLGELEASGVLRSIEDDADYTVYRVGP